MRLAEAREVLPKPIAAANLQARTCTAALQKKNQPGNPRFVKCYPGNRWKWSKQLFSKKTVKKKVYQNLCPNKNSKNDLYQNLCPNNNSKNDLYQNLCPNKNCKKELYQNLCPNKNCKKKCTRSCAHIFEATCPYV